MEISPETEEIVPRYSKIEPIVKIEMKVEPTTNLPTVSGSPLNAGVDSDIEFVSEEYKEKVLVQKKRIKPKPKRKEKVMTDLKLKAHPELIECPICHKTFVTKNVLKNHVLGVHEKIKRFKCEVEGCDYGSYIISNLKTHKIFRHNDIFKIEVRQFFCEICGISFTSNTDLNTHRNKVHLNIRRFGCGKLKPKINACGKVSWKIFTDICGRWFYGRSELKNHMITHQKFRKLFKCKLPGCGQVVSTSSLLRYHKAAVHDKVRRFQCDLCGKSFYQLIHLKSHCKGIHSKIKDLQCSICSKLFSGRFGLKQHISIHHAAEGEKPSHPCKVCGVSFAYKSAVVQHMRIHKDPEFECNQCKKKYFFKKDLLDHMEKHETLAFPCEHCSRSFRNKSKLDWHLKNVHFKEKRTFRCEVCMSTFTRRTTVRDHVLRQHKELEATFREDLLTRIANMTPEEAAD